MEEEEAGGAVGGASPSDESPESEEDDSDEDDEDKSGAADDDSEPVEEDSGISVPEGSSGSTSSLGFSDSGSSGTSSSRPVCELSHFGEYRSDLEGLANVWLVADRFRWVCFGPNVKVCNARDENTCTWGVRGTVFTEALSQLIVVRGNQQLPQK